MLYTLPMNSKGYVPFLILLYTLPINTNGYVPFLILLYTLPMNTNGYVPFLINTLDTIASGRKYSNWRWCFSRSRRDDMGAGEVQHSRQVADPPQASGAILPGSSFTRKGKAYREAPEVSLFSGMPTGPEAFLESPSVSGLRFCAQIHLKKDLCRTRPFGGVRHK